MVTKLNNFIDSYGAPSLDLTGAAGNILSIASKTAAGATSMLVVSAVKGPLALIQGGFLTAAGLKDVHNGFKTKDIDQIGEGASLAAAGSAMSVYGALSTAQVAGQIIAAHAPAVTASATSAASIAGAVALPAALPLYGAFAAYGIIRTINASSLLKRLKAAVNPVAVLQSIPTDKLGKNTSKEVVKLMETYRNTPEETRSALEPEIVQKAQEACTKQIIKNVLLTALSLIGIGVTIAAIVGALACPGLNALVIAAAIIFASVSLLYFVTNDSKSLADLTSTGIYKLGTALKNLFNHPIAEEKKPLITAPQPLEDSPPSPSSAGASFTSTLDLCGGSLSCASPSLLENLPLKLETEAARPITKKEKRKKIIEDRKKDPTKSMSQFLQERAKENLRARKNTVAEIRA